MSAMREGLLAAMTNRRVENDELMASFEFDTDFVGFQGHFPGNPVLPAVCKVRAAILLLEAERNRTVRLLSIERARFSAPTTPGQRIDFRCKTKETAEGDVSIRATVTRDEEQVARFRLRVRFEERGE